MLDRTIEPTLVTLSFMWQGQRGIYTLKNRPGYEIRDFTKIPEVACPCGTAKRALESVVDFPGTIHVTNISREARLHYHKSLTETYFILQCNPNAAIQLDDEIIPVHENMCILIRPGVRHRAIGEMRVLIIVFPKFDPQDEWVE